MPLQTQSTTALLPDPSDDTEGLELPDIIDIDSLQLLMDHFQKLTGMVFAILDLKGTVLVAAGWQDICTKFHRCHPETAQRCRESDIVLTRGVEPGQFKLYRCRNNMWDVATPLLIGGRHMGNLLMGQFLFTDEEPDRELFRQQAKDFGFIVRRLGELLGGTIAIDSTVGKGTTFYISLPLKMATGTFPDMTATGAAKDNLGCPLQVLLAEDDAVSSYTAKRLLEKAGCHVATAKDGREALQLLAVQDFDLVLMDIQMPSMDGVEAARAIRGTATLGSKTDIPIVAMTAYAMTGDKEKFLAAGMDDYLAKPVDKQELMNVIERVLGPSGRKKHTGH